MSNTDGEEANWYDAAIQHHKKQEQEIASLREQLKQLQEWKESEINLWSPILEYMQHNPKLKLGSSITETTLKVLKEYYNDNGLKEQLKQQEEVIRVLTAIIDEYITMSVVKEKNAYPYYLGEYKQIQDIVKKAKSLTTKDK